MDSITQAALGATVAGAIAGKKCNAKVLLAGAALGTLPDLDVMLDYGDAVSNTINHRGFSHSLLVLPPLALLISWLYSRFRPDSFWTFSKVFILTLSVLVTHPLLDAMTTYGTQLLWPIHGYFAVSSVFIIDPLYTLPLLAATGVALVAKDKGGRWCRRMLILSTLYLGWGYAAQQVIADRVEQTLSAQNIPGDQVLITATPFNTLLWRILVIGDGQYHEGLASLLDREDQIDFVSRPLGHWPITEPSESHDGLKAFSRNFLSYREEEGSLIASDLRMGMAEQLSFEFVLAERNDNGEWKLTEPPYRYESELSLERFDSLWERLKGNQSINANLELDLQSNTAS